MPVRRCTALLAHVTCTLHAPGCCELLLLFISQLCAWFDARLYSQSSWVSSLELTLLAASARRCVNASVAVVLSPLPVPLLLRCTLSVAEPSYKDSLPVELPPRSAVSACREHDLLASVCTYM